MMVFSLLEGTKIDIGEIIYTDLITRLLETPRKKYVAYPRFISCVLERLMNIDYTQDTPFRSTPLILSKQNFNRNSSKVQPNELTKYMLSVVNHQASVSPTPSLKKLGKKKKSQTVTKPKTKLQGPKDSIIPPKVTKVKKQAKPKKTSLIYSTQKFTQEKEPSKATDTSQSVSSGYIPSPQDIVGNIQPAVTGPLNLPPKDGTLKSKLLLEGNLTDPQES
ncbi:hypothetical protein Tco_0156706 [Tanacetum coccineum]